MAGPVITASRGIAEYLRPAINPGGLASQVLKPDAEAEQEHVI
jgi:hypothetical protein